MPGLNAGILEHAFEKLLSHDFVLGPAADGGYYLIGMKKFYPAVFEGIEWSTSSVFEKTIDRINGLGKTWSTVQTLRDLDDEADWKVFEHSL